MHRDRILRDGSYLCLCPSLVDRTRNRLGRVIGVVGKDPFDAVLSQRWQHASGDPLVQPYIGGWAGPGPGEKAESARAAVTRIFMEQLRQSGDSVYADCGDGELLEMAEEVLSQYSIGYPTELDVNL